MKPGQNFSHDSETWGEAFLLCKEGKACHNEFEGAVPFACRESQCPAILMLVLIS